MMAASRRWGGSAWALRKLPTWVAMCLLGGAASLMNLGCSCAFAEAAGSLSIGGPGAPEHHPGKIIWADLATPDLTMAERFYGGLFGWTFHTVHSAPLSVGKIQYAVATLGDRAVAGLVERPLPSDEHRQPLWLTFIAVRDVDAAEKIAMQQGAHSVSPARNYAGRGRQAVLTDPEGAVFAVLASSSGDSPDFLAEPGEWIWSSLLVSDPSQTAAFYKTVFGYEVFDLPDEGASAPLILSTDDYARASVNPLPTSGHRRAHWLNFVRVISADESVVKAQSLGGKVLVEPHVDRHGGKIAVIADPAGAPLGLMEWSEKESKAEPQ